MMNYKIVTKPGEWVDILDAPGYVTTICDIIETKTDHVVATLPSHPGKAKALCRHLNLGGGFDGWTPSFFLARIPVIKFGDNE